MARERDARRSAAVIPWIALVLSTVAAIAAIWSGFEARRQASSAEEEARLDRTVALVRLCAVDSRSNARNGDDIFYLSGSTGSFDYDYDYYRSDVLGTLSGGKGLFLICDFTNYSRVPLLEVTFYVPLKFHGGRVLKEGFNRYIIPAINPGETHRVWFINDDSESVAVDNPTHARFLRFPDTSHLEAQAFVPDLPGDEWTLRANSDPYQRFETSRP